MGLGRDLFRGSGQVTPAGFTNLTKGRRGDVVGGRKKVSASGAPRDELQRVLQAWEPAEGPAGFEGLVAVALAEVSGLPVRLARSGSQFGRDGLSMPGDFVLAFEAKRYRERVPLQEMTTKAALAAYELDRIDHRAELWACAMTVDLGDVEHKLNAILEDKGITLLVLDYPTGGLSPLAVLLAAARDAVVGWTRGHARHGEADDLDGLLRKVETDGRFSAALGRLRAELAAPAAGLAMLAQRNREWARETLGNAKTARRRFSQSIAPATATLVPRQCARKLIEEAVTGSSGGLTVLLGGEGSGKTWLAADWWLQQPDVPILLFAAGPLHHALDSLGSGEEMIAELLSQQHGEPAARWQRRVRRWRQEASGRRRFAVVVDGLNERAASKNWATILGRLAETVAELGGTVIATCRPEYWHNEVANRLADLPRRVVEIGDFDEEEAASFFLAHGIQIRELPEDLHDFVLNPRIAALAVRLLPRLSGTAHLSRDRLLLEYWRERLNERGDQVAHNDEEFGELLAAHARAFRDSGTTTFPRAELRRLSGQVVAGGRTSEDELAEIRDGHFLAPVPGGYRITGTALPVALGLLIFDELRKTSFQDAAEARAFLDAAFEPVSGFDQIANALAAAGAIAVTKRELPDFVTAALIGAWFGIQNRNDDALRSMAESAATAPAAFMDAYEQVDRDRDSRPLLDLINHVSHSPEARAVLERRLPEWLGSWTEQGERYGGDADAEKRQKERTAHIAGRIDSLRPNERQLLDRTTTALSGDPGLAGPAVQLMIGMPLAVFAPAIVDFAFVGAVKGHDSNIHALFCWMLRSNPIDYDATREAIFEQIEPLLAEEASTVAKQAAAIVLESMGHRDDADLARMLWPREPGQGWRRVEQLCDVDPLDPGSAQPPNLHNALAKLASLDPATIHSTFGVTFQDNDLEMLEAPLARFEANPLIAFCRRLVGTIADRTEMPLRQLGWHLPELSALVGPDERDAIERALEQISGNGAGLAANDSPWIAAMHLQALFPHLTFAERVEIFDRMPEAVALYDRLAACPMIVSASEAENALAAVDRDIGLAIARRLHLLGATAPLITPGIRRLIVEWLTHEDTKVASLAADFVRRAGDSELDRAALESGALEASDGDSYLCAVRSAAFASALVRQDRQDLLDRASPADLGWVAGQMGHGAIARFRNAIDSALDVLLRRVRTPRPETITIQLETGEDGLDNRLNFHVREVEHDNPIEAFEAMADAGRNDRFEEGREELRRFVRGVTLEGAGAMVHANWLHGLDEVVGADVEHARGWASRILDSDTSGRDQVQSLALALAAALSSHDPGFAARLFRHALSADAIVDTLIGGARIPLRLHALFRAAADPELDRLRMEQFISARSDAEIEAMVAAAQMHGSQSILDAIVAELLSSSIPARQALALTITGLRSPGEVGDALLASYRGQGFLGQVAGAATDLSRRARWFQTWHNRALEADDPAEYWRYALLASRCIDRRNLVVPLSLRA